MASQFGLQTGNQYFPQPVRSDLSRNLLAGAESAQRLMQLKAQEDRTKIYEQQVQQQQETADVEKARQIYDTWQVNMPVDPTKPEESIVKVFERLPELEKSLASAFPNGVPSAVQMGVDSIKKGDPGPVLQGMYEYRNKLVGAKPQKTPEQLEADSLAQARGKRRAEQEIPLPNKDRRISIGTRRTEPRGDQEQVVEWTGDEWVEVKGASGKRFRDTEDREDNEIARLRAETARLNAEIANRKSKKGVPLEPTDIKAMRERLQILNGKESGKLWGLYGSKKLSIEEKKERDNIIKVLAKYPEQFIGEEGSEVEAQGSALPEGVTEEDIQYTMEQEGMTREEVLQFIGAQ